MRPRRTGPSARAARVCAICGETFRLVGNGARPGRLSQLFCWDCVCALAAGREAVLARNWLAPWMRNRPAATAK